MYYFSKKIYGSFFSSIISLSVVSPILGSTLVSVRNVGGYGSGSAPVENLTEDETDSIDGQFENGIPGFNKPILSQLAVKALTFNPKFTSNYFSKLQQNMPTNNVNNCGFVALSCVLSMLDAFVSDNFIPEQYEASVNVSSFSDSGYLQSPGVDDIYEDLISYSGNTAAENFSVYLKKMMSNGSFVGHLYSLAIDKGLLTLGKSIDASLSFKDYSLLMSAYLDEVNDKLSHVYNPSFVSSAKMVSISEGRYYSTNPSFAYKGNTVSSYKEFRQEIINKVSDGQPVIIGTLNHFCIAYEYNAKTDTIYGNLGWKKDKGNSHVNLDKTYGSQMHFWYSYDLSKNIAHTHSNNYSMTENSKSSTLCSCELDSHICENIADPNYYCYCRCKITHDKHSTTVVPYDIAYHGNKCSCGRIISYEKHDFDDAGICKTCHFNKFDN